MSYNRPCRDGNPLNYNDNRVQCVPCLGCSRYLFDTFNFVGFGGKWPLNGNVRKACLIRFDGYGFTCESRQCQKVGKMSCRCADKNTMQQRGTRPSPNFVLVGPMTPKIFWTLSPLDLCLSAKFGPGWLRFAGVIIKRLVFLTPKIIAILAEAYGLLPTKSENRGRQRWSAGQKSTKINLCRGSGPSSDGELTINAP